MHLCQRERVCGLEYVKREWAKARERERERGQVRERDSKIEKTA